MSHTSTPEVAAPKTAAHDQEQESLAATEPVVSMQALDTTPSEKLMGACSGCRLSFSWFRTNKSVDPSRKRAMARAVESTAEGFSASKRLMDSKHPAVKQVNDLRSRVQNYWNAMTLPLAQGGSRGVKGESGTRLIRRDQAEEFHRRMSGFLAEARRHEDQLNGALTEIMTLDRERLGELFDERDYPHQVQLSFSWSFPTVQVPNYLAQIAPEVYRSEVAAMRKRFENTFDLATTTMMSELKTVLESWVERLGPVVRIHPPEGHPLHAYAGSELLQRLGHDDEPEAIPAGLVRLEILHKPEGSTRSQKKWLESMTPHQFAALRPAVDPESRRAFKNSTIEHLVELVEKFRRFGKSMSTSNEFEQIVADASQILEGFNGSDEAAKKLRDSRAFRGQTHSLMSRLSRRLESEVETFKEKRRKVRRDVL